MPIFDQYAHLVGSFVGNGSSQFVPTAWDPQVVWVKPTTKTGVPPLPGGGAYRHLGMPTAITAGSSTSDAAAITLGTGGFTVGATSTNKNGVTYGFLAMKDPSAQRMAFGSYLGQNDHAVSGVSCTPGDIHISTQTDQWVPADNGLVIDFGGLGAFLFTYVSARSGLLNRKWPGGPTFANPTMRVNGRQVGTGLMVTHAWICGRVDIYSSLSDFPTPGASILANAAQSQTDLITGFAGSVFTLGNSNTVNAPGTTFYWLALSADAGFQASAFRSGQVAQSGGTHVIGVPFQPAWIVTQQYISFTIQPCWRQLGLQPGNKSNNYTDLTNTGVSDQTTGITAVNASDFHTGTPQADNGVPGQMVWYAFTESFQSPDPDPDPGVCNTPLPIDPD